MIDGHEDTMRDWRDSCRKAHEDVRARAERQTQLQRQALQDIIGGPYRPTSNYPLGDAARHVESYTRRSAEDIHD